MIAITGGGTGGHIFPIVAVVQELRERGFNDFIWIGQKGGKEEGWAKRIGVSFKGIPSGKLRRYFSLKNFLDLFKIFAGFIKSLLILRRYNIDILFSKGGFVSVPPVIAARIYGIPVATHESDITPGLANRINSKFSKIIFLSFEETKRYFKNCRTSLTGNPIRSIIKNGNADRGRRFLSSFLDLDEKLPLILVLGGSLGAKSINKAIWDMVNKHELDFYLIHQCGSGNMNNNISNTNRKKYLQIEFIEEEIGDVLKASNLIVSRAGAGAIYEIGYTEKPAIFIPLPLSGSRGEQIKNAYYLKKMNAAEVLDDEKLNGDVLYKMIKNLLSNPGLMNKMAYNFKSLIIEDAEKRIADEIVSFIK